MHFWSPAWALGGQAEGSGGPHVPLPLSPVGCQTPAGEAPVEAYVGVLKVFIWSEAHATLSQAVQHLRVLLQCPVPWFSHGTACSLTWFVACVPRQQLPEMACTCPDPLHCPWMVSSPHLPSRVPLNFVALRPVLPLFNCFHTSVNRYDPTPEQLRTGVEPRFDSGLTWVKGSTWKGL